MGMINIVTVFLILLLISIIDFYTFRIPDILLSYILMFQITFDIGIWDPFDIVYRFVSALLVLVLFYSVWRFYGNMGFGDVKFVAVLAYVFGFFFFFSSFLLATVLCLLIHITRNKISLLSRKRFPLAPYLTAGCLINSIISRMLI